MISFFPPPLFPFFLLWTFAALTERKRAFCSVAGPFKIGWRCVLYSFLFFFFCIVRWAISLVFDLLTLAHGSSFLLSFVRLF